MRIFSACTTSASLLSVYQSSSAAISSLALDFTAQLIFALSFLAPAATRPFCVISLSDTGSASKSAFPSETICNNSVVSLAISIRIFNPSEEAKFSAKAYCNPMGKPW